MSKPVILLAFADYKDRPELQLRGLPREQKSIVNALLKAQNEGICEVIPKPAATLTEIMEVFAKHPVAVFHYAGHADDFELMLSESESLHSQGFAEYLGKQPALQLVVLNACSTKGHVDSLIKNGVKAVIATSNLIKDDIAVEFAKDFYFYIGLGKSIFFAFNQFEAKQNIGGKRPEEFYIPPAHRALIWNNKAEAPDTSVFPWFYKVEDDFHLKWNLADAAGNPLFGLPDLEHIRFDLPPDPFLYLRPYERSHAEIFYGRAYQIRELYDKAGDMLCPPVMLVYGQSGVGKTSLIQAGLLPYLEMFSTPFVVSRHPSKGLTETLRDVLEINGKNLTLKQAWQNKEKEIGGRPVVIVIDDVEEALVQPYIKAQSKFAKLVLGKIPADTQKMRIEVSSKSLITNNEKTAPELTDNFDELTEKVKLLHPSIDLLLLESNDSTQLEQIIISHLVVSVLPVQGESLYQTISTHLNSWKSIFETSTKPVAIVIGKKELVKPVSKFQSIPVLPSVLVEENQKKTVVDSTAGDKNDELQLFINELKSIFGDPNDRPSGKVILVYRKEYHSEIDLRIKQATIPRTRSFIEPLTKQGIGQVVNSLTLSKRAQAFYNLNVETGLSDLIANDLLSDRESAIAPYLQILLTKMWVDANLLNPHAPQFTRALYLNLKDDGILLTDFFDQKLEELSKMIPGVVESGFVLELLRGFINRHGTVSKRKMNDIFEQYQNARPLLPDLIERLKRLYLIVETPASDGNAAANELSFSHDILAPVVREMHDLSDRPVQRANRILKNKLLDWSPANKKNLLDPSDLAVVESALQWLPKFNANEEELINLSNKNRIRLNKTRLNKSILWSSFIATLLLAIVSISYLWRQAVDKTLLSLSYDLSYKSGTLLDSSPTKSFRLAEFAFRTHDNNRSFQALWNAYHQSAMYSELNGHTKAVNNAVFSPDGSKILTASADNSAIVWFLSSGDTSVYRCPARVNYATFSPDGAQILVALSNDTAILYNTNHSIAAIFAGHLNEVSAAVFSPDQQKILTASWDNTAKIWDTHGNLLQTIPAHEDYLTWATFSPSGDYILTTSVDKTAKLWKGNQLLHTFTGHTSSVNYAAFSPDEQLLVTTSDDQTARLWNIKGEILQIMSGHNGFVEGADFSANGQTIATVARDYTIKLWDNTGVELQTIQCPGSYLYSVAFAPHCPNCLFAGGNILTASEDNTARIWSIHSNTLGNKGNEILGAAYSQNGKFLVSTSRNRKAVLWDIDGKKITDFTGHKGVVVSAAFSANSNHVITASADSTAKIWNTDGREIMTLTGHNDGLTGAVFNNLAKQDWALTSSKDKTARLWDLNGKLIRTFSGHTQIVESAIFSPDDKYILTTSRDSLAKIWRTNNGNLLYTLIGHEAAVVDAAFSPDGRYIVTASRDKTARLWTFEGRLLQILSSHTDVLTSVAFFPEGNRIITTSADKTAKVWNLKGEELFTLSGHQAPVENVTFTPDNSRLLTASKDGIAKLWLIHPDSMIADANLRKLAFLTPEDMRKFDVEDTDRMVGIDRINWLIKERNAVQLNTYAQYYTLLAKQKRSLKHYNRASQIYLQLFRQTNDSTYLHKIKEIESAKKHCR
ncbi:MAG: CHAT domain-containing protein [Sphingobacteriales bacterium]|nr:MAG: CHAT domain-containing protein [Sphingobacteriales bacterium]